MLIMLINWAERIFCKKNTESLVVASKESGLEVSADKTKHQVMSRDQHVRRSHNVKTVNNSFEQFMYSIWKQP
jgi:hypothetical protein